MGSAIALGLEEAGWSVVAAGRAEGDVSQPEAAVAKSMEVMGFPFWSVVRGP